MHRLAVICLFSVLTQELSPCSRIFWNNNDLTKVSARTMDLYIDERPMIAIHPIGIKKSGDGDKNSVQWTSKYGSVVVTGFKVACSDGMNDQGLSAHLLYLHDTTYEARDKRPSLANSRWVEFVLDNYKSVKDAIKGLMKIQIVPVKVADMEWPLHMSLEDKSGDSAIFEFIKGKLVIHHNREAVVMTNEPAYSTQVANLKNYAYFGGKLPLPGDVDSISRFVRLSAFLKTLTKPTSYREAIAFTMGVIRSAQVPFGALNSSNNRFQEAWPTRWVTVSDLTNLIYFFNSTQSPNIAWIDLTIIPFKTLTETLEIDLHTLSVEGDVSPLLLAPKNG